MQITPQQLFITKQAAQNFGTSIQALGQTKRNHQDELIENIHYFKTYEQTNGGRQEVIKWTLRGIVVLGFFIRSKEAKNFRIWASNELEKSINAELQKAKEARARNLALTDKVTELDALLINKTRRHHRQINGYKSQISRHNTQIATLKRELKKAQKADIFAGLDLSEAKFQPFSQHRPSYKELWFECINILGNRNALKVQNEALRAQNEKLALQNKRLLLILGNINAQTAQLAQI
ncbi:MAG: hypothetical protein ACTTIV_02085 [Campylobacter sp.]